MRPWTLWLVERKLKFVIYIVLAIFAVPYLLFHAMLGVAEGWRQFTGDWRAIKHFKVKDDL